MAVIFSMASGVTDSFFGKSQEPIKMMVEREVEGFEQMSALPHLFKTVKSNNFAEKFTGKTSMGNFLPVGEGGAYPQADLEEGYSKVVTPETWKNSFTITREMIEDKKTLDISAEALGFTQSFGRTKEEFGAAMFANATNTSMKIGGRAFDLKGADGKAMFAADHTNKVDKQTQSNKFTDAFSADALAAMECAMQDFKDDNGHLLSIMPDTIVIPNDYKLKRDVFAAIGADKDPNTANNGFNFQFGRWTVIVWNYLRNIAGASATATPFMLLDSKFNKTRGGAIWIDRKPLSVHSYVDNGNDNNIWAGRARFGAGFNNWRPFAIGGMANGSALISAGE